MKCRIGKAGKYSVAKKKNRFYQKRTIHGVIGLTQSVKQYVVPIFGRGCIASFVLRMKCIRLGSV